MFCSFKAFSLITKDAAGMNTKRKAAFLLYYKLDCSFNWVNIDIIQLVHIQILAWVVVLRPLWANKDYYYYYSWGDTTVSASISLYSEVKCMANYWGNLGGKMLGDTRISRFSSSE